VRLLITLSLMLSQNETQPKHTLKVEPDWLQFEVMTGAEKLNREREISAKSLFVLIYREGIISPVVLTKRVMERARFIQLLPNFTTM
jgi:hypothetical protein